MKTYALSDCHCSGGTWAHTRTTTPRGSSVPVGELPSRSQTQTARPWYLSAILCQRQAVHNVDAAEQAARRIKLWEREGQIGG